MSFRKIVFLCLVVPFFVVGAVLIVQSRLADARKARHDYENLLKQNILFQCANLDGYFHLVQSLTRSSSFMLGHELHAEDVDSLTNRQLIAYLRETIGQNDSIIACGIAIDPAWRKSNPGRMFQYLFKERTPSGSFRMVELDQSRMDYVSQPWYQEVIKTGKTVWLAPEYYRSIDPDGIDNDSAGWGIAFSLPLLAEGKVFGVMTIGSPADFFIAEINKAAGDLDEGAYCVLINSQGVYCLHPDFEYVRTSFTLADDLLPGPGRETALSDMRNRKIGAARVHTRYGGESEWLTMVQAPLASSDWTVAVFSPENAFMAETHNNAWLGIAAMLGGLGIAVAIAGIGMRYLFRPLGDLVTAAERIGQGNFEQMVGTAVSANFPS